MRTATNHNLTVAAACGATIAACLFAGQAFAAQFIPLGDSPATALSSDGSTVVGFSRGVAPTRAWRWTAADGRTDLPPLTEASPQSRAHGVSADGLFAVGFDSGAVLWRGSDEVTSLGPRGIGYGVSRDGSIVVGSRARADDPSGPGFPGRWVIGDGGAVTYEELSPSGDRAWAVTPDGRVIVGDAGLAFRWTEAQGLVSLGALPGHTRSFATATSTDGARIVGGSQASSASSSPYHPFLWTEGTGMVPLGDLPGGEDHGYATGVSDAGVVVGHSVSFRGLEYFIWHAARGMRSLRDVLTRDYGLDLTGWDLTATQGGRTPTWSIAISADGTTLLGTGVNPAGATEAWMAVIPEPACGFAALGFAMLIHRRRRRPA